MKAFLGMGLLGSNFVKAMAERGEQVQIWNRTAGKAQALAGEGIVVCDTPAEAVKGAQVVHLVVKDDAAVDAVLEQLAPGLEPGATLVDHTTTSAAGAKSRTQTWKERGYLYQHAPVFMGPKNAREASGYMLVSGDQDLIARLLPDLSKMTGKVLNFGAEAGKAAGMKLLGNLFLMAVTGGITDMLLLAKNQGISIDEITTLFDAWNPGAGAPGRLKRVAEADYSHPSWELQMARKDAGLMMDAVRKDAAEMMVIPAIAAQMDHWINKGHGHDDWTIIGKDAVAQEPTA